MSEIFDFLKKTENERRRALTQPVHADTHQVEPPVSAVNGVAEAEMMELAETSAFEAGVRTARTMGVEAVASEEQIMADIEAPGGRFDLSGADKQIKTVLDPLTLVGEQFRVLRSKLGLMQKQRGIKTILVTSTAPEEGKTFTACGLAGVMAQEPGRRVILIDADMRKPSSGRNLGLNGMSSSIGLSRVLSGEMAFQNALLNSTGLEFYFLPAGPLPRNPSELLSSQNLEHTIRTAASLFDWVIIDSPPVQGLADTTLLAHLCDAVLLVVRADTTPTKLVVDTVQKIGKERICGIVMNRQKHIHSSRYYYSYYHPQSRKGQE
jgi:protein-tyrosine kinase